MAVGVGALLAMAAAIIDNVLVTRLAWQQ